MATVAELEAENSWLKENVAQQAIELVCKLVSATSALFECEARIFEDWDPEFPHDRYTVIVVETKLESQRLVEAEREWIRIVEGITPHWNSLRLSIRPS